MLADAHLTVTTCLLIALAYCLGSLCTAIFVCRALKLPDPRTLGSGNPGATNVMRIGGKQAAGLTLAGDAFKGVVPVLLAHWAGLSQAQIGWVGLAAVLGHMFPLFFGFKGGKGVATTLGVIHSWHWPTGLIIDAIWLTFAKVFKISSAAAIVAMLVLPLALYFFSTDYWLAGLIISGMSLYRHKSNIQQLLKGQESVIGQRVHSPSTQTHTAANDDSTEK